VADIDLSGKVALITGGSRGILRGTQTALGRIGEPGEIVGAALYFASDASTYTTDSIVRVNGGTK
jgi:NAD(P)-dependent dehydrogenase (short-subunit alcohol dehydrogenase family)